MWDNFDYTFSTLIVCILLTYNPICTQLRNMINKIVLGVKWDNLDYTFSTLIVCILLTYYPICTQLRNMINKIVFG